MTQYTVLAKQDDEVGFLLIGEVESTTDKGAIRKALQGVTAAKGQYVAVPTRSWRPRLVEAETKTELKIA